MRTSTIERKTKETDIKLSLTLPEPGETGLFEGSSGIGFFDHMLNAICVNSGMKIKLAMKGDLEVDGHHSVEDLGIVLGQAFKAALASGKPVRRYGSACIPMDESLSRAVVDLCGRPYLVFNAYFKNQYIGQMETDLFKEFFYAFVSQASVTLHMECLYGENDHHKAESLCKAFAHAIGIACEERSDVLSTKGMLEV